MKRSAICMLAVMCALILVPTARAQSRKIVKTDDLTVTAGGYIKSLTTYTYDRDTYNSSIDTSLRIRIKIEALYKRRFKAVVHYEIAGLWGESLNDPYYRWGVSRDPDEFLDLYWILSDSDDMVSTHSLDRLYLSILADRFTLTLGRQRIAWGTARFISAVDLFNPFDPAAIDKEEKLGVDAAVAEIPLGAFSGLTLVFAPDLFDHEISYAARIYSNQFNYDLALTAGRFVDRYVFGFDFAGQVWDIALFGEIAYIMEDHTTTYPVADPGAFFGYRIEETDNYYLRGSIGAEYIFENSFSILVEYYYNGKGARDREHYNLLNLVTSDELSLGRHYLFSSFGYDIMPLLRGGVAVYVSLTDFSVLVSPSLEYSITENLYLNAGAQLGIGTDGDEYEMRPDLYYIQLRYYF